MVIEIDAAERDALDTALVALEDVAEILEGGSPTEVGIDPDHPGRRRDVDRLRRAQQILQALMEQ